MTTNNDNPAVGRKFEDSVGEYLRKQGHLVDHNHSVEIGLEGSSKKPHKFDWGNDTLLVECKAYTWTKGGNRPSAKLSTLKAAMLYFIAAPKLYVKMLFMQQSEWLSEKDPVTLAEYYVRQNGHLIPKDVEIHELNDRDPDNLFAKCIWPHPGQ